MKWLPGSHQTIISNYKDLALFLKEKVEQHKSEWVNDNPKDYIDAYLSEIEKVKNMVLNFVKVLVRCVNTQKYLLYLLKSK